MLHENEVVMLLLGVGNFIFITLNKRQIKRINAWKVLISSYYLLLAGWIFTILEGYILENFLNLLEHICYAASAIMLTYWCWKTLNRRQPEDQP